MAISCIRFGHLGLVSVLSFAMTGCGLTVPPGVAFIDYQADPAQVLAMNPRQESRVIELSGGLGGPDRERLAAFIAAIGGNRPESLQVEIQGAASPAQFSRVREMLIIDGVPPKNIVHESPPHGMPSGAIVIAVERAVAVLPECPGWADHESAPTDNLTNPNFGCSVTSNLAVMLGSPRDLARGQSNIYADGERAASTIDAYRADKVKDLPLQRGQFEVIPTTSGR
jgi:pilus biogenesis lipoprotein CpaD